MFYVTGQRALLSLQESSGDPKVPKKNGGEPNRYHCNWQSVGGIDTGLDTRVRQEFHGVKDILHPLEYEGKGTD